tara:strand:- start:30 stop:302 length:273 start_codon:yes stop_codon:yes gene_type:complete
MGSDYKRVIGKYCSECLEDIDDCAKDGEVWSQMGGMVSGNATCPHCGLIDYVEAPVFIIDQLRGLEEIVGDLNFVMEQYKKRLEDRQNVQ